MSRTGVIVLGLFAFLALPRTLHAQRAEYVTVVSVAGGADQGIVQRTNGEQYLIEKGVGCLSFWRYEGRRVLVTYSATFGGVGSTLVLPDANQSCRIWDARYIGSATVNAGTPSSQAESSDISMALAMLGHGGTPAEALKSFQTSAGIAPSDEVDPMTRLALSQQIAQRFPNNLAALELARRVLQPPTTSGECQRSQRISDVSRNGEIVTLLDGSVYQIDAVGQIRTMLWLPTQQVIACGRQLINVQRGQEVGATRLR